MVEQDNDTTRITFENYWAEKNGKKRFEKLDNLVNFKALACYDGSCWQIKTGESDGRRLAELTRSHNKK